MGVIKKQSISGTIYSYVGVILGFAITILFTKALGTDQVGLLKVLVSYSTLLAQFASLGFTAVTVKLFPYFRDEAKKHHGFIGLALLVSLAGFVLSTLIYLLIKPYLLDDSPEESELFKTYFYYVIPLIFFTLIFTVFDTYYRVLYNAVKGIVYKEVIQRASILGVIVLYYFKLVDFHTTVILYCVVLILPSILLLFSLIQSKQLYLKPDFSIIDKPLRKQMVSVGFYGIVASFSGVLVMNIDVLMINEMMGLSSAGIYTVTFYFGTLILIPMRTMGKIGAVVVADAWKRDDYGTIDSIYKKSSMSLTVLGLLLFIGIWGNIDNVFEIINKDYLPGKYVIFFIGIANLVDIATGMSSHIIVNSKYYKYLSYFLIIFAFLIVVTNYIFIPVYGIVGAAVASLIAKLAFSLIKYIFLYVKFRFQPFTRKFALLILISLFAYGVSVMIPPFSNYMVDLVIRSAVITVLFMLPLYFLKISEDVNEKIDELLLKLKLK